jgi:DNA-binding response OmpR family regulator
MRILAVDDDSDYLCLLVNLLQARGHDVLSAHEGKEARELLDVEHVELIVSDVFMPTLDGVWFHSYVREFSDTPDTPFVFISCRDNEYTRDLAANRSVDLSLSKMLGPEELVEQIEHFAKTAEMKRKQLESPLTAPERCKKREHEELPPSLPP